MAPRPDRRPAAWSERLRSGILLVGLVVLLGLLTAATAGVVVLVGAAVLDRALG